METVKITCTFCKQELFSKRQTMDKARSGHLRHCTEYIKLNKTPKKRALEPDEIVLVDNFVLSKRLKEAEQNDFYYDLEDWENIDEDIQDARKGDLQTFYDKIYGSIKPSMESNMSLYIFQMQLMALYNKDGTKAPIRTGWVRDAQEGVATTSWEDYIIINRFYSKHGLSLSAGDELLGLIREIGEHHKCMMNIPKTMRSIRYVTLCFGEHKLLYLMFFIHAPYVLNMVPYVCLCFLGIAFKNWLTNLTPSHRISSLIQMNFYPH